MNRRPDFAPMAEVLGAGSRIVGSHFVVSRSKGCPGLGDRGSSGPGGGGSCGGDG